MISREDIFVQHVWLKGTGAVFQNDPRRMEDLKDSEIEEMKIKNVKEWNRLEIQSRINKRFRLIYCRNTN